MTLLVHCQSHDGKWPSDFRRGLGVNSKYIACLIVAAKEILKDSRSSSRPRWLNVTLLISPNHNGYYAGDQLQAALHRRLRSPLCGRFSFSQEEVSCWDALQVCYQMLSHSYVSSCFLSTNNDFNLDHRKGCNLNDKNKEFLTPLHLATDKSHYDVMELLLKHGAKVFSLFVRSIWSILWRTLGERSWQLGPDLPSSSW